MLQTNAFDYQKQIPRIIAAMAAAEKEIGDHGLDPLLRHLVKLRASQVNGCAHCVKMHTREARADGETNERLDRLVVWRHVDDYTPREKAALAFTEAMTRLDDQSVLSELRAALREHFSEQEVAALGADVAMINLWNRISISNQ